MAQTTALTLTPSQLLQNILQTIQAGLANLGIQAQIDQNSDFYITATALANQLGIGFQNLVALANASMPDTATGDDLTRIAAIYGIDRKVATGSDGFILTGSSGGVPTNVSAGAQLTSSTGLVYQIVSGGIITNTGQLEVESVDTGLQTNLATGSILTWQNAPGFLPTTVTVVSPGLSGGSDEETDQSLRARLLSALRAPPVYGNWKQVATIATKASPQIENAYVYPAINGPSTQAVVFTQAQTPYNITNRGVTVNSQEWFDGYNAVQSSAPMYIQTTIPTSTGVSNTGLSVVNQGTFLSFQLNIPYPRGAQSNGIGGGWLDFTPYPNVNPTVALRGIVSSFYSLPTSTSISVISYNGGAIPNVYDPSLVAGITHVSWIADFTASGQGWKVLTSLVTGFTNIQSSDYLQVVTLTLQTPFIDGNGNPPQNEDSIFPSSVNGQNYLDTIIQSFAGLGPGEMNTLQILFPNSYRQPLNNISNPYIIDARFCQALVVNNAEVETASFYECNGVGSVGGAPGTVIYPLPPANINIAPTIFVPQYIGWYV